MSDKSKIKPGDVVRVTGVFQVADKIFQPNTLIKNLPEVELKIHLAAGRISADVNGIKYCKDVLKVEVVDYSK
ncbi:MAG: hypothetical protein RPR40_10280 [Bermanella sp.]